MPAERETDHAAIDWITGTVLAALEDGDPIGAVALTFLLRRYTETDGAEIRDALEPALASALERHADVETDRDRAAWLTLFVEALALSSDERIHEAAEALAESLRRARGSALDIRSAACAVDAALRACGVLGTAAAAQDAIDELERLVGAAYRPGEGLVGGHLVDHIALSSALLTAFALTGRLPYSMLAEELIQFARRTGWSDAAGCFVVADLDQAEAFLFNCEAARVLCRMAALHGDRDYLATAVIRSDAAYAADAVRILDAHGAAFRQFGVQSASYGLALAEWLALQLESSR